MHLKQDVNPPFQKRKKGGQLGEKESFKFETPHWRSPHFLLYIQWALSPHMFQMHNKSIYFENLALKNLVSSKPETPQLDWHV